MNKKDINFLKELQDSFLREYENGISLSQLNEIINTHLKRIDEMEKGLR
jgi:hypothetical protein